ncbi:unnamed protein product [Caenorhabditis sp. 36 PRJEB53466]|nr:unnamed protein product [Caenorhabditis sp. 36 PRJEB53466]
MSSAPLHFVISTVPSIASKAAKNTAPPDAFSISRLLQPGPFEFRAPSIDSFYFAPPPIGNVPEVTKAINGYILFIMCMRKRKLMGLSTPSNNLTTWNDLGPLGRKRWCHLHGRYSLLYDQYVTEGRIRQVSIHRDPPKLNREERNAKKALQLKENTSTPI